MAYGLRWTGARPPPELNEQLIKKKTYSSEQLLCLLGPADLGWLEPWVAAEEACAAAGRGPRSLVDIRRRLKKLRAEADA